MYFLIGISLLFACLYTVNLVATGLLTAFWRLASRRVLRLSGRGRADLLFILRVLPTTIALIILAFLVLPSFLLFEPTDSGEALGWKLLLLVGLTGAGLLIALWRVVSGWLRTRGLLREWMRDAERIELKGVSFPAFKIRHPFPVLAVVGVFRQRIFVAEQVLAELDDAELAAALSHEAGHIAGHDNLKRVAMRICGDLLVVPLGHSLDLRWTESAESASDEYAAASGGPESAINLASALIKISRLAPAGKSPAMPLAAYLIDPTEAPLASRIDYLVGVQDASTPAIRVKPRLATAYLAASTILVVAVAAALGSNLLFAVHSLSERFLALLR